MNKLFEDSKSDKQLILEQANKIKGLELIFDFITQKQQDQLLSQIDNNVWLNDLSRRVQHYGYKYHYKARRIDSISYLGQIPSWLESLAQKLFNDKIIDFIPDQVIVNEYLDNQGIAHHIDCEPCFTDCIVSISLAGSCVMDFVKDKKSDSPTKIPILIPLEHFL